MGEQVGNKAIDSLLIALTLMMFVVFPILFVSGLLPLPQPLGFPSPQPSSVLWYSIMVAWLLAFFIFLMSRAQLKRTETDKADKRGREFPAHPSSVISGSSFVIPSYCPYCSEPIVLEDIHWIQSDEFACHECHNIIRVTIKEEK